MVDQPGRAAPRPRIGRAIVLTPMMGGADGISEMTRQWVRVLEAGAGRDIDHVDIWSLDDEGRPGGLAAATGFQTALGSRARFGSWAIRDAIASAADTLLLAMHLQLLPVALPLVWRGARLLTLLMGIEAWAPLRPLERAALQRSWKVVAISSQTAARFRAANAAVAGIPVAVCRPGVPPAVAPAPGRLDGPYALIVGRMDARERYKGHDALIELWPRARQSVAGARLVIAGDGDDSGRLREKAGEGVVFVGRVDDARLAALYRDAAFFVMPSTDEGFGLVYLEAMRAATPCIAARGAAEEIITDRRDGLIVDAHDREALLAAIVTLFADPLARARMGAAAAVRVDGEFSQPALERRVRDVLELREP